jgi:dTMP kinase
MAARPWFIVFEGIDGSGKTTQAKLLVAKLNELGIRTIFTAEPSDGPFGKRIREAPARLSPSDEEQLFREDRRDHLARVILPALEAGVTVICDRYIFSSAAYQGARGLDPQEIVRLNREFAPAPDLIILLEISAEHGLERIRCGRDCFTDFEKHDELVRVAEIYVELDDPALERISAKGPVEEIHGIILGILKKRGFLLVENNQ